MSVVVHSPLQWSILAVAALVIGLSKTGLPGIAILAIPLAALVLPAKASTGIILPMLIAGDLFAVTYYRRHAQWGHLFRLLPWGFLGIIIGYFLLATVTDSQLRPVIGAVSLTMLIVGKIREQKRGGEGESSEEHHRFFAAVMGLLAGIATMMANAAGPIMTIYLVAMNLPKRDFVGTAAWYFFIVNCVKVPFSVNLDLITRNTLLLNLSLLPAVVAGALLGIATLKKLPERKFAAVVQIIAGVACLRLLF